ncbi:SGNH/GDSL hydrolase family protein [Caldimonas brevitalea]|uniref:Lysophospholipase L1 n=1 Tax=Caldimonas brevitalea TaxID=413882 RepID=A0A0G3BXG7_9BURK|nr:SGNH/GDSL hydrolase family protein [Caldimonas brevitalea]AKJ31225.1 lysophospholipase L1 [Caldimonas brevitalea]
MWGFTKLTLSPLLVAQGLRIRKRALVLPEADGAREGLERPQGSAAADTSSTTAAPLRLLVVGDSSAAGVGAATQDQALACPLARDLAQRLDRPVSWRLLAETGLTTQHALALLRATAPGACDVVLVVLGVNDVLTQVPPPRAVRERDALWTGLQQHCQAPLVLWSATPPLEHFPLLPWPLRSVLGHDARRLNQAQATWARTRQVLHVELPPELADGQLAASEMAEDGFHPGPTLYARWAAHVGQLIAQRLQSLRQDLPPFLPTTALGTPPR